MLIVSKHIYASICVDFLKPLHKMSSWKQHLLLTLKPSGNSVCAIAMNFLPCKHWFCLFAGLGCIGKLMGLMLDALSNKSYSSANRVDLYVVCVENMWLSMCSKQFIHKTLYIISCLMYNYSCTYSYESSKDWNTESHTQKQIIKLLYISAISSLLTPWYAQCAWGAHLYLLYGKKSLYFPLPLALNLWSGLILCCHPLLDCCSHIQHNIYSPARNTSLYHCCMKGSHSP